MVLRKNFEWFLRVPGEWKDDISLRRAEILHVTHLLALLGSLLYFLIPSWLLRGQSEYILGTIIIGVIGSALLRAGKLKLSGFWTTGAMWLLFSIGSSTEGGITSGSFAGTLAMVIFGGLAYGVGASIAIAIMSIAAGGILIYLKSHGMMPVQLMAYSELNILADFSVYTTSTAVFTSVAIRRIEKSTSRFEAELKERRRVEEALRDSERQNRAIVEAVPDLLFRIAADGTFVDHRAPTNDLLYVPPDEFRGKRIVDVLPPVVAGQAMTAITLALASGTMQAIEYDLDIRGTRRSFENRFVPLSQNEVLSVIRDTTQRKHAEEEWKRLQEQLLQAQRVESIGTLAGGIAHDFNNLLGIIAGHTALLEENSGSPLARSASIGAINKAVERGANLVQQILTFARKTDVTVQPISIPDLVKDLFSLLRETFPRVISFATQFQDDLPPVSGDYSQVHQVLLNLCVNARDAMPGGGTLTISAHRACGDEMKAQFATAEAREYVRISVTDTGMGLDESVRKRIFDPFFTTKEKGKGTGLGLAVVYGVTQTHKGFIDVDSTIGKGSTFHIFLPSSTAAAHPPPLAARGTPSKPGRSETILVVEDEELLSSMLRSMLELNGYSVLVAKDGEEAIGLYEKKRETIDLVLTDLGLPGVGGDTVFRTLRKMNPRARVVLASGFVEPDVKNALMAEGVKEFIQKPYTPQSIIQCIRAILDTQ